MRQGSFSKTLEGEGDRGQFLQFSDGCKPKNVIFCTKNCIFCLKNPKKIREEGANYHFFSSAKSRWLLQRLTSILISFYKCKLQNIVFLFSRNDVTVTPILGILVAIGSGLALVAVAIILVLRFRPGRNNHSAHSRRHKQRTYLSAPHLPLDQQHR